MGVQQRRLLTPNGKTALTLLFMQCAVMSERDTAVPVAFCVTGFGTSMSSRSLSIASFWRLNYA